MHVWFLLTLELPAITPSWTVSSWTPEAPAFLLELAVEHPCEAIAQAGYTWWVIRILAAGHLSDDWHFNWQERPCLEEFSQLPSDLILSATSYSITNSETTTATIGTTQLFPRLS